MENKTRENKTHENQTSENINMEKIAKEQITNWLKEVSFSTFVREIEKQVIGQENLSLFLANVYNYLTNVACGFSTCNNTILAAPSGSGKTETYRTLRAYFKNKIPMLPVYVQDMSRITATGYKGMDAVELLNPLFINAHQCPSGIIFLDEFDKKIVPSFNGMGDDINREAQSCLLTLVEGGLHYDKYGRCVDTSNLMFVGLGSFDMCRESKSNIPNTIGFGTPLNAEHDHFHHISKQDLIESGGTYELVGRFPIIINYDKLSEEGVCRIIEKTVQNISITFDCEIKISQTMKEHLISNANSKFGCRMLDGIIRQMVLREYMVAHMNPEPEKKLVISLSSQENVSYSWEKFSLEELREQALMEEFQEGVQIDMFS